MKRLKLSILIFSLLLCANFCINANAAERTEDGITTELKSEEVTSGEPEKIKATLTVTNTNEQEVKDVILTSPDSNEKYTFDDVKVGNLAPGKTKEVAFTYYKAKTNDNGNTTGNNTNDNGNATGNNTNDNGNTTGNKINNNGNSTGSNSNAGTSANKQASNSKKSNTIASVLSKLSPKTGEQAASMIGIFIAIAGVLLILLFITKKNKKHSKRILSIILVVSMGLPLLVSGTSKAAEKTSKSIICGTNVTINGESCLLAASLNYNEIDRTEKIEKSTKNTVTRAEVVDAALNFVNVDFSDGYDISELDYYNDINDSKYKNDIEVAARLGLINKDDNNKIAFHPDDAATRDFAASTIMKALDFNVEGVSATFSDSADAENPQYDELAVKYFMMSLDTKGNFLPKYNITKDDFQTLLKGAANVVNSSRDSKKEDETVYQNGVILLPADTAYEDNGTNIVVSKSAFSSKPDKNDIFIIGSSKLGDSKYKVSNISEDGDKYIIDYSEPDPKEYIFSQNYSNTTGFSNITADDVTTGDNVTLVNDIDLSSSLEDDMNVALTENNDSGAQMESPDEKKTEAESFTYYSAKQDKYYGPEELKDINIIPDSLHNTEKTLTFNNVSTGLGVDKDGNLKISGKASLSKIFNNSGLPDAEFETKIGNVQGRFDWHMNGLKPYADNIGFAYYSSVTAKLSWGGNFFEDPSDPDAVNFTTADLGNQDKYNKYLAYVVKSQATAKEGSKFKQLTNGGIKLFSVATPIPGLQIAGKLKLDLSGKLFIKVELSGKTGFQIYQNSPRNLCSTNYALDAGAEAEIKFGILFEVFEGLDQKIGPWEANVKLFNVSLEGGAKGTGSLTSHAINGMLCAELKASPYLTLSAMDDSIFKKIVTGSWDIYQTIVDALKNNAEKKGKTFKNHLEFTIHWEYSKFTTKINKVDECTFANYGTLLLNAVSNNTPVNIKSIKVTKVKDNVSTDIAVNTISNSLLDPSGLGSDKAPVRMGTNYAALELHKTSDTDSNEYYNITVSADGYQDATVNHVVIGNTLVYKNVDFTPAVTKANGTIKGKVLKADDRVTSVPNATISAYDKSTGQQIKTTTTAADGSYSLTLPAGSYKIVTSCNGYIDFIDYETVQENKEVYLETYLLIEGEEGMTGTASGSILDSQTGYGIADANITFRKGWNNKTEGDLITVGDGKSDSNGKYSAELPYGNYTMLVSKNGYTDNIKNIIVKSGTTANQDCTLNPSNISATGYSMVLTWGQNPRDLDSHVNGTKSDGAKFHVYYRNKNAYDGGHLICNLDHDDTTSYGPETITLNSADNQTYYYYIYKYAGSGTVGNSGAQIKLYKDGNLINTYNVPTDQGDGRYWNVFAIKNGTVVDRNTITDDADIKYCDSINAQ